MPAPPFTAAQGVKSFYRFGLAIVSQREMHQDSSHSSFSDIAAKAVEPEKLVHLAFDFK